MSKFTLEKAVEKTRFVLEKKQIKNIKAHVVVNLDVSGSTQELYRQGMFQKAFQQVLPIGILFDDNQEIDTFTFSNGNLISHITPNATGDNYTDYIEKNIINAKNIPKWGGTDYASVLKANVDEFNFCRDVEVVSSGIFGMFKKTITKKQYCKSSESGHPVIVFFFTDGENSDQSETYEYLEFCQRNELNIYFLFIGIGHGKFDFLKQVDKEFANTEFLHMDQFDKVVDDDSFVNLLLTDELCCYLKEKHN